MNIIKLVYSLVLLSILFYGCSDGGGENGGSGSSPVYETSFAGSTFYLLKKSDHFLMYREEASFDCYVFFSLNIVSRDGDSYFVEADDGQEIEFVYSSDVITAHTVDGILEFHRNNLTESNIKPKCGNAQAQGEISVAITFQQLPDTIPRGAEDYYDWIVTFDMDDIRR